jgi:hypothetical protein
MAYTYDPRRGVYLDDGAPIAASAVRDALRQVVADSADRLQILAERRAAGRLETPAWRDAARRELRTSYVLAAGLAAGGGTQLGPAERGLLGATLREAYGHLDGLTLDWAQGRLSEPQLIARSRMYAGGAHSAYEQVSQRGAQSRGSDRVRNVLGAVATEHCAECPALAARGWVPLGAMPLPGRRACLTGCRCTLEYTTAAALAATGEAVA